MSRVYLDNSATTKLNQSVKNALVLAFDAFGNPSSLYFEGHNAKNLIEDARESIANAINAQSNEIIFTSGGSESNNTILNIAAEIIKTNDKKSEIIVSAIEHPSIIETAKHLGKKGIIIHYAPVDKDGRVNIEKLRGLVNEKTALISVMSANNETGVIQDIKLISQIAHESGALVHTDAVQVLGKIDFDVNQFGVDYASFSAHKIGGLKGVGVLYVKKSAPYETFIFGGHQENGRRAGTSNTLGIISFGEAVKNVPSSIQKFKSDIEPLKNKLRDQITELIPEVVVNGDQENVLPNILNVSFAGAEGESIMLALDCYDISVSTGSACAAGDIKPSHVLMAMKADSELAHGSIRFSFGTDNTINDVDLVMKYLPGIIKNLREISTVRTGVKK